MIEGKYNIICRVCDNAKSQNLFLARELQLGLLEEFEYFECGSCGCVQMLHPPEEMSKYYPPHYYSFHGSTGINNPIRLFLLKQLMNYRLFGKNILGGILSIIKVDGISPYHWIQKGKIDYNSKILDVGCGSGDKVVKMSQVGFKNILGIDPFIEKDIYYNSGASVLKKSIDEMDGQFDMIMLHHSLEHMNDQHAIMKEIHRLLKREGSVIIRIPVASSYNYRKYKSRAFHLDPPRHFYLHTITSFEMLARKHGFLLASFFYDTPYSIYLLHEKQNRNLLEGKELFLNRAQNKAYKKEIKKLNLLNDGDTVCFYLYKP